MDSKGVKSIDPAVFAAAAGKNYDLWNAIVGQKVNHLSWGFGTVTSVKNKLSPTIWIKFDKPQDGMMERHVAPGAFLDKFTFLSATIEILKMVEEKEKENQRMTENEKAEAQWKEEEEWSSSDFQRLKRLFNVTYDPDNSPLSPRYTMLQLMEKNGALEKSEEKWLKETGLDREYEALSLEQSFEKTDDLWRLVKASSVWRKIGNPKRGIEVTTKALDRIKNNGIKDSKLISAVWTTRGGNQKDVGDLDSAGNDAEEAIRHQPNSYYPHNLLGAVYYQRGLPGEGDVHFQKAVELGSSPSFQDNEIRTVMEKTGVLERKQVAEYLIQKDPERYFWALRYL